ncbi:MAG: homoserine O-succinyltransferase [Granulosicoccus sp.]|nr:homoserine O-succinyltransferase [Granulosicoccus sp.]
MPLVAHSDLPTFKRLQDEGNFVLSVDRARDQDIRGLHVGLLNMMPDAALEATERQFLRLIGSSNPISQFFVHPFTLPEIPRGRQATAHIEKYYENWETIQEEGLDALIITGANVTEPDLAKEVFWQPLIDVIDWAENNITSTLCSCLATHAVMQFRYNEKRLGLDEKMWGVFDHDVVDRSHPLVQDINTRLQVPHSRFNVVERSQFERAGLHVLIEGDVPGVQLAVSPDGFRVVFFQGHPEYDRISLMKEYKREVGLYLNKSRDTYPPFPQGYFDSFSQALLTEYASLVQQSLKEGKTPPVFPEEQLVKRLHNTWHDSGEAVVGNWIGLVYQLTHAERKLPYMEGIDLKNPLDWRKLNDAASHKPDAAAQS